MSIPAWRPLKDAPKDLSAYVDTDDGEHVAQWANGRWFYWGDERPRYLSEDTPSLPIAETLELDRARALLVAQAFAELFAQLALAQRWRPGPREGHHRQTLRVLTRDVHAALGGRIPDEATP